MQTGRPVGRDSIATEPRVGLVGDVVDELRWTFSGRKGWLFGIGGNLVLALGYVGYNHYDPSHVLIAYSCLYLALGLGYWVLGLRLASLYARSSRSRLMANLARSG